MSYLELSNPTTDSCDYEVYLSSPFNQDYYIQIRITSTDYGASTSNVRDYVVYKDAPANGTSHYVRDVVDDGMSAGKRYTLYAYAQAANGTWYLAGEDTIRTLDDDGEKYDYGFKEIEIRTDPPYNFGDEIKIAATVLNYRSSIGPDYIVELRDKNGDLLDEDSEPALDGDEDGVAFLYPVLSIEQVEDGRIEYTLRIVADESGWVETDSGDNAETVEVEVSIDGNDDFSTAKPISLDYSLTGTIDQDNDQDYFVIEDIPDDCEAFMVMIDYNDVPHEGDYDCDIYVYDENENRMCTINGVDAGTTYAKVPVTGTTHYIRIDFDGDFTSSFEQQYNMTVAAIPVSYVEHSGDIDNATEIHEGMNVLGEITDSEEYFYTITPVADRKLKFVVQADDRGYDYSIILMDENEDELDSDTGASPVFAEYDLEEGKQYFIKVSPEDNATIENSIYLLSVEVPDVGGTILPLKTETFGLDEDETRNYSFRGAARHQYLISFDKSGEANFYFERTSGDCIPMMELFESGSANLYPNKILVDESMLITANVDSTKLYKLVITNLAGNGNYLVRCKLKDGSEYIQKLKDDTSLGLSSSKKDTLIETAKVLLESNFEISFIAGLLGNIVEEGDFGQFEDNVYISNPKPPYLVEAEKLGYNTYAGRNITEFELRPVKNIIDACAATGYVASFGLGCVQWTFERTMGLINIYIDIVGIDNKPTFNDCLIVETKYMIDELHGSESKAYDDWLADYVNDSPDAAYDAGEIICLQYERPDKKEIEAPIRANNARDIYNVLMG